MPRVRAKRRERACASALTPPRSLSHAKNASLLAHSLSPQDLPTLDYAHFSPNCKTVSNQSSGKHGRKKDNDVSNSYLGTTPDAMEYNKDIEWIYRVIREQQLRPGNEEFKFTIEAPEGERQPILTLTLALSPSPSRPLALLRRRRQTPLHVQDDPDAGGGRRSGREATQAHLLQIRHGLREADADLDQHSEPHRRAHRQGRQAA